MVSKSLVFVAFIASAVVLSGHAVAGAEQIPQAAAPLAQPVADQVTTAPAGAAAPADHYEHVASPGLGWG